MPLIVTAGVNDAFSLTINDTEYTIHLTPNTYTSIDQVVAELNQCLNGPSTPLSYKGMINVSASGSTIRLTGADGKNVDKINVKAVNGNGGFDEVFQGYTFSTVSQPASGTGSVILNTPFETAFRFRFLKSFGQSCFRQRKQERTCWASSRS